MREKMKAFLEAVSKAKELFDKLNAIPFEREEEKIPAAIAFAKDELGIELTEDDFKKPEVVNGELNDDELEAVAGGGDCWCFAGGGGTGDGEYNVCINYFDEYTCACVLAGAGEYVFEGEKYTRCMCAIAGSGAPSYLHQDKFNL